MHRVSCPYCNGPVEILDSDVNRLVQCDRLGCGKFFLALDSDPTLRHILPVHERSGTSVPTHATTLTGPHRCPICQGTISKGLGKRRCTVLHRSLAPQEGNCRMDIYAAIYFCPHCRSGTLLETPYYQWGQQVTCPHCRESFQAPRDDILDDRPRAGGHEILLHFTCPSCFQGLRSDTQWRGRSLVGQRVVCRSCLQVIEIPSCGEATGKDPS